MCWMVKKEAGKQVNFKYMDKAQKHNGDGYGVSWYEDEQVKTYKTFNYNQFKGVVAALKQHTLIAHLRYATKGNKTFYNIHPFDVPSGVMFHNGTMFGLGDYKVSDSRVLAKTISLCDYNYIEDIEPLIKPYIDDRINRLIFFEDNGRVTIMNEDLGITEDGAWYSNDYHLKADDWSRNGTKKYQAKGKGKDIIKKGKGMEVVRTNKVFVYGTLKRGYNNHSLLEKATLLGKAVTKKKWTMIGKDMSFPYVMEQDDALGKNVVGEVYVVNSQELASLDRLEGVPYHYISKDIEVIYTDDNTTDKAAMYIKSIVDKSYRGKNVMLTEWMI